MCQKAFFPCLQVIKLSISKREAQKTDVGSAKKKIQQSEKKIHCSLKKKVNLKIKLLKNRYVEDQKGVVLAAWNILKRLVFFLYQNLYSGMLSV